MDVGTLAAFLELDTSPFDKELGGIGGKLGKLGAVMAGAGAVAGAALVKGVMETMDIEKANDKLAAQLGATGEFAKDLGSIAGNLYADAYGESLGEVNEALKGVMQNGVVMEDATNSQIESITGKVMDLATAFDQDLNMATQAVGTMMRTGLAPDADAALDVITRGMQQGANKADDLLETFQEYSTMFRDIGLSAADATGLLTQGLQAGARDADTVADALKEFAIRGQDASTLSAEGFKLIGLNAGEMTKAVAAGGPKSRQALDTVLDRLRTMEDPVKRNAAAVALFGTKAEDLGDALFALDPSDAVAALGQVEGAAAKMGETLNDNAATKIESFKRRGLQMLTDFVGDTVIPALEDLGPTFEEIGAFVEDAVAVVEEQWPRILEAVQPVIDNVMAIIEDLVEIGTTLWRNFGDNILGYLEEVWPRIWQYIQGVVDVIAGIIHLALSVIKGDWSGAWSAIQQILSGAWSAINGIIQAAITAVQAAIGLGLEILTSMWAGAWRAIHSTVVGWAGSIVEFVESLPAKILAASRGMWAGISGSFKSAINTIIDLWNGLSFPSMTVGGGDPLGSFGPSLPKATIGGWDLPNIPRLHSGGTIPNVPGGELLALVQSGETVLARNDPLNRAITGANAAALSGGSRSSGRGEQVVRLFIEGTGLLENLRYTIRTEGGGDVQLALGA